MIKIGILRFFFNYKKDVGLSIQKAVIMIK